MGSIEEINIKSRTYSFLMTYSRLNKVFNPDLLKIVKIGKIIDIKKILIFITLGISQ